MTPDEIAWIKYLNRCVCESYFGWVWRRFRRDKTRIFLSAQQAANWDHLLEASEGSESLSKVQPALPDFCSNFGLAWILGEQCAERIGKTWFGPFEEEGLWVVRLKVDDYTEEFVSNMPGMSIVLAALYLKGLYVSGEKTQDDRSFALPESGPCPE